MARQTGKDRRKQKKKREERRRRAELRGEYEKQQRPEPGQAGPYRLPQPPSPHFDRSEQEAPPKPARENTPTDDWWGTYLDADGQERLRMVRDKLPTIQPGDPWYEAIVPEAIFEIESGLPRTEYVEFLEELRASRPEVFAEGADWHTWSMAFIYVAEQRWEDLDQAIFGLADRLTEVREPFFSLVSLVRLAGREEAALRLIDAAMAPGTKQELMPWAVDELIEWALFPRYQACVQAGVTDEAVEEFHRYSVEIGCDESEELRQNQRDYALHLAGKGTPWPRDAFVKNDRRAMRRVYLLTVDLMRWLCASRGMEPVVADEFRRILIRTLGRTECKPTVLLRGLHRHDLEPAIARNLDFLSLDRAHAPAAIIALRHFYDFLAEVGMMTAKHYLAACSVCDELWNELKQALGDEWQDYQFLEAYWLQSDAAKQSNP